MNEYQRRFSDLTTELDLLFKRISALYDFFSNDNKYLKKIPFNRKKLLSAKTIVENANRNFSFNKPESAHTDAGLKDIEILINDLEIFLAGIVSEIEKITGRKIVFRSAL